jgi:prolyl oligopeptidase
MELFMPKLMQPPPHSEIDVVTDFVHGVSVADPYRWLEDQDSPRTRAWIAEQSAYTRTYLQSVPGRGRIRRRVLELLDVDACDSLQQAGDRYFFRKRAKRAEQFVIAMKTQLDGEDTVLVDPASLPGGASAAVRITAISRDGRFLAYSVRHGGTGFCAVEILDVNRRTVLPDRLPPGYCTGFAFTPEGSGYCYCHRTLPEPHRNRNVVLQHRFGAESREDTEVLFAGDGPHVFVRIIPSYEPNLFAYAVYATGKSPTTAIWLDTRQPGTSPKLFLEGIEGKFEVFFVHGQLCAYTDMAAPNFRIVRIEAENSNPTQWRDIVPQSDRRIRQYAVAGNSVFITRIDRFTTSLESFSVFDGHNRRFSLNLAGTIDIAGQYNPTDKLFYRCTSLSSPSRIYCYDTAEDCLLTCHEASVPVDSRAIGVEVVSYRSTDGTRVPILLAARKDRLHCGPLPTFLTGYGGFAHCVTPRFSALATFLIENGCLFAVPAIRGGSELGEQWHAEGKCKKRQNAFDDFFAAAEWLVQQGRATARRIAIGGGSNAGLLVAVALTQHPDFFRAAICLGPLVDMVRYHRFDFAARWANEYGTPEDEGDFRHLFSYSPYHHVRAATKYPSVLFVSGDADTRCNPMHARKITARLQAASTSGLPILLDYRPGWGHIQVQPQSERVTALTDRLAFVCKELGINCEQERPS